MGDELDTKNRNSLINVYRRSALLFSYQRRPTISQRTCAFDCLSTFDFDYRLPKIPLAKASLAPNQRNRAGSYHADYNQGNRGLHYHQYFDPLRKRQNVGRCKAGAGEKR